MTQHDDILYLGHMYESSLNVLAFAEAKSLEDLESDQVVQYAIVHALQIIGEAARRVTEETKKSIPGIEWKLIIAMRHKIVHDYFEVDIDVVWDTIKNGVPNLIQELAKFVQIEPPE